ncbi:hypothetical protein Bca4012_024322 [Brassica carinata]
MYSTHNSVFNSKLTPSKPLLITSTLSDESRSSPNALKEEKLKQEEKYMWVVVDGVKENVGNLGVEPPRLFRGRGEHPKMEN